MPNGKQDSSWGTFFLAVGGAAVAAVGLAYTLNNSNQSESSGASTRSEFDGAAHTKYLDNRSRQLNPNHLASGPGRAAGYQGAGTKKDLDNHANQLNPNNPAYAKSRDSSN